MIYLKTPNEISIMARGGRILAEVLFEVLRHAKVGVSELELDKLSEKLIKEKGAEPGFKKVRGYHHSICVSTNDIVVHGIPTNYGFKMGDVVGVDCGVYYKGFHTDMAETRRVSIQNSKFKIQNSKDEIDKFLETGRKALEEAIRAAKVGNRVGHISQTIQKIIEGQGYSVVRSLVGHGVGKKLHEKPEVPGFLATEIENTTKLIVGMTLAIEVIYNKGGSEVVYAGSDGWTIKTKDNSLSALFERTVAITKEGPLILTQ